MLFKETLKRVSFVVIPAILATSAILAFNKYLDFRILEIYNAGAIGKIGEIEERDKEFTYLNLILQKIIYF